MTLRCRPGDLAIYVGPDPVIAGRLCTVLRAAPVGRRFTMPDDRPHIAVRAGHWIVEFPRAVAVPLISGNRVNSRYGVTSDWLLRPIRPDVEPFDVGEPAEAAA